MQIANIDKFFLEIFKANKLFVLEAWEAWQGYISDTLKADVERSYPDGFKDFLVQRLEEEIKKNTPKATRTAKAVK